MKVCIVIYIYTQRPEKDGIWQNDLYFNLYTGNQPFTEEDKAAIQKIDHARLTEDLRIETEYGLGTIRNLSSGCKTYLNIIKNPGKIVCTDECGGNVLEMIFQLNNIHICMTRPERFPIQDDIKMCFNGKEIVKGRSGYEHWWSEEYERRKTENDL